MMLILLAALLSDAIPAGHEADVVSHRTSKPYVPDVAVDHEATCAKLVKTDPAKAEIEANVWRTAGGGVLARQCLGLALAGQAKWAPATEAFEQAARDAELQKLTIAPILWMQGGNAALAGDEPIRARNGFDRALALPGLSDEMKGEVHLDRARAGVAANDLPGARVDLNAATKLVPRDPLGWLLTANLARKQKDMPAAFAAIREATRLAPNDPAVAYEAGNLAAATGQIEDAKAAWTRAAQADPDGDAGQAAALALKGGDAVAKP
jgi:tetratricopeptide (TPR) repeat protein